MTGQRRISSSGGERLYHVGNGTDEQRASFQITGTRGFLCEVRRGWRECVDEAGGTAQAKEVENSV